MDVDICIGRLAARMADSFRLLPTLPAGPSQRHQVQM